MDELMIQDLRSYQYPCDGKDWRFFVGQKLPSINSVIYRIYLDQVYLASTGNERIVIEVTSETTNKTKPWKLIRELSEGKVTVKELNL